MSSAQKPGSQWGHSYRLIASEKWKIKSAAMGRDATHALVDYARPQAGMQVLDLASGTGEPAITLASRIGPEGHVVALDLSPELLQIAEERVANVTLRTSPPVRPMPIICLFPIKASISSPAGLA